MDDLGATLEVSTLVEFYVVFTLCFGFKVVVCLQPSSGKTNPSSLKAGFPVKWLAVEI